MNHSLLSRVAQSNLFTKGCTVTHDKRQAVLDKPGIPDEATRKLCAELILEEALETIHALGFDLTAVTEDDQQMMFVNGGLVSNDMKAGHSNIEEIVDGCCDLIYVATGALVACGVPDLPHLQEVNECNDAKFPNGEPVINHDTGKYLKPVGWQGPDHGKVMQGYSLSMLETQRGVLKGKLGMGSIGE